MIGLLMKPIGPCAAMDRMVLRGTTQMAAVESITAHPTVIGTDSNAAASGGHGFLLRVVARMMPAAPKNPHAIPVSSLRRLL